MSKRPLLVTQGPAYETAGLVHRVAQPETGGAHPTVVMIHGRLGSEDVMWIFQQTLPPDCLVVAPRAIVEEEANGYSWHPRLPGEWPDLEQFDEAVDVLTHFIHSLPDLYEANLDQLYLMGFSQGAATAFALAMQNPGWVKGIASLVGFMPRGVETAAATKPFYALPVFMAAATEDDRVPLAIAQESATAVRAAGADLEYHEYNTGHKLNGAGMRQLKRWWGRIHT